MATCGFRIERRQRRGRGAQHVHRMRVLDRTDDIEHRRRQFARRFQLSIKARQLLFARQIAVEQQPGRFLEAGMLGEIVDRITAIAQLAGLAVDEGAGRTVEIDARETAMNLDRFVGFGHCLLRPARRFLTR